MSDFDWVVLSADNPELGKCMYTVSRNAKELAVNLPILVTIEWEYQEMDENKFPAGSDRESIFEFDELISKLEKNDEVVEVMRITDLGLREWAFQTTSFDLWLEKFNEIMSTKPKVPIEISYSEDPDMEYWGHYAQHVAGNTA